MQTTLGHLLFGVQPENMAFYRELLGFLGWQTLYDDHGMLGVADTNGVSMWFGAPEKSGTNDYDAPGLNHFAIGAASQADVDATVAYLRERQIAPLFETPRHRPDFAHDDQHTYYQVMFETPDRLLIEVVYTGPLAP